MSTPVDEILTHKTDALKRLLEQYKNKPNLKKVIEIYADRHQELETVFQSLFLARSVFDAVGVQLDQVGEIVGFARPGGIADEPYRTLIFVKIGQNVSEGEMERIINVAKLLTSSDWVHAIDILNGNLSLTVTSTFVDQDEVNSVYRNLELVLAGGVRITSILCADPVESFAFEGLNASAPGLGFSDDAGLTGGKFAEHHTNKNKEFAFDGSSGGAGGFGAGSEDPLAGGLFVPA